MLLTKPFSHFQIAELWLFLCPQGSCFPSGLYTVTLGRLLFLQMYMKWNVL